LHGPQGVKVLGTCWQRVGFLKRTAVRVDQQHRLQTGQLALQAQGFRPQLAVVFSAMRDQHLGVAGPQQRQQFFVAEQGVERLHNARRFAAPQRQVIGQATGQQNPHGVLRAHTQLVQQIGGLVDALQQAAVGPGGGLAAGLARVQKAQRRLVGMHLGTGPDQRIGAGPRHGLGQGRGFDALEVGQALNGR
jgi:hypothetical protein